jgi:tight adherence protein B
VSLSHYTTPALFLLLLVGSTSWHFVSEAQTRARLRKDRVRTALDRHERMTFVDLLDPEEVVAKPVGEDTPPLAARIFRYDPRRLDLYPVSPTVVILGAAPVAFLIAFVASTLVGSLALLLAIPLWPLVTRVLFARWRNKRLSTLFEQFPDALAMIVRGVRVGVPVSEAINIVSNDGAVPTKAEFGRVGEQITIGVPLDEALRVMAERNGLPEYRFFATALALQGQTGGNLSETLEGLAETIRKRVAARARGYALAAEARTSANVLIVLPMLLFVALWFMNPSYIGSLTAPGAGRMVLGGAVFLLSLGVVTMRTLIKKSLS